MYQYLVNHLPTGLLILVLVGGPTLIVASVVLVVDKAFPRFRHVEFDGGVRDVVGLVFGLVLALVIAANVAKHDEADSAAGAEATATAQLTRAMRAFSIDYQLELGDAIGQYVRGVVEDEWPAMRTGENSPRAAVGLDSVYAVLQRYHPRGEPAVSVYRQALLQADKIGANRRDRLDLSSQTLPPLLRVLLILGALSFVVLSYPGAIKSLRKRIVITTSITAFVCFAYLLTIVFDYPFSGELAVGNSAFKEGDLAVFWASSTPIPVRPHDVRPLTGDDVIGYWTSKAFGPTLFRKVGGEIRGVLRLGGGTVVAHVEGGILRGTWCELPTRRGPRDLGQVEWRMTKSRGRDFLVGGWRFGTKEPYRGGWELSRVGDREFAPPDLARLFDRPSTFCRDPTLGPKANG